MWTYNHTKTNIYTQIMKLIVFIFKWSQLVAFSTKEKGTQRGGQEWEPAGQRSDGILGRVGGAWTGSPGALKICFRGSFMVFHFCRRQVLSLMDGSHLTSGDRKCLHAYPCRHPKGQGSGEGSINLQRDAFPSSQLLCCSEPNQVKWAPLLRSSLQVA